MIDFEPKMKTLDDYIIKEILKLFSVIFLISCLIFLAYSSVHFLENAASGELPSKILLPLISLKVLIACEVLLPLSLFLSGVQIFSKMHADREIVALQASGISLMRLYIPVVYLVLFFCIITACLSMFIRPWSYKARSWLQGEVKKQYWFRSLSSGRFYQPEQNDLVLFIKRKNKANNGEKVFIQNQLINSKQIVYAKSLEYDAEKDKAGYEFLMYNGSMCIISGKQIKLNVYFEKYNLKICSPELGQELKFEIRSRDTNQLLDSDTTHAQAELQWRYLNPGITILLGILCLPISITGPWGRHFKTFLAMLIYAGYYVLQSITETWVEKNIISVFPGTLYAGAFLVIVLIILLFSWRIRSIKL